MRRGGWSHRPGGRTTLRRVWWQQAPIRSRVPGRCCCWWRPRRRADSSDLSHQAVVRKAAQAATAPASRGHGLGRRISCQAASRWSPESGRHRDRATNSMAATARVDRSTQGREASGCLGQALTSTTAGIIAVGVGRRQPDGQRDAAAVGEQVVLGAGLAAVCRVRAGQAAPRLARTLSESRLARDQSMRPSRPSSSSSSWCSRCQTPARCQSRRRRQQVTGCRSRAGGWAAAARGRRCAAGRPCRQAPRGRQCGAGRRSGVAGWAAAAGWPATAAQGRGRRWCSWPRIMLMSRPSSKNQPKVGNTLLTSGLILIRKSTVRRQVAAPGAAQRSRVQAVGCAPTQAAGWRVTL
jgi:hypothetical protein